MTIGDCLKIIRQIEADCAFLDAETDNDLPIEKTKRVMNHLESILHSLVAFKGLIEKTKVDSLTE